VRWVEVDEMSGAMISAWVGNVPPLLGVTAFYDLQCAGGEEN
jgi:hypothetical protein